MTDFISRIDKLWTLFLDRDGVINQRIVGGYVAEVSEFNFSPGVLESMSSFATIFGRVVVVTNQQGIGKGLMTHHQLSEVHKFMITEIEASGGRIDAVYYCSDLAWSTTVAENLRPLWPIKPGWISRKLISRKVSW